MKDQAIKGNVENESVKEKTAKAKESIGSAPILLRGRGAWADASSDDEVEDGAGVSWSAERRN